MCPSYTADAEHSLVKLDDSLSARPGALEQRRETRARSTAHKKKRRDLVSPPPYYPVPNRVPVNSGPVSTPLRISSAVSTSAISSETRPSDIYASTVAMQAHLDGQLGFLPDVTGLSLTLLFLDIHERNVLEPGILAWEGELWDAGCKYARWQASSMFHACLHADVQRCSLYVCGWSARSLPPSILDQWFARPDIPESPHSSIRPCPNGLAAALLRS
ncbi:hypothetical protein B0T16DRAFT_32341 [Cercophora newfieldiana]|uniref:Uncharacterized protein n=1 Tax=Cercophora newfieldiana TaxID=92897 RepID=A0AA40CZH5_9PEZI|nr:hypothetical protein B0T16DRAFT_32341 [Cercophora newfieldiana]